MAGFSHNLKIANTDKEAKLFKDVKFEPESLIDEKIGNAPVKLQPKSIIYNLTHNGYATIIKADESENSYLCRLRLDSDKDKAAKDVKSTAEELTRFIKVQVRLAATQDQPSKVAAFKVDINEKISDTLGGMVGAAFGGGGTILFKGITVSKDDTFSGVNVL
jgi:hypothetical protein